MVLASWQCRRRLDLVIITAAWFQLSDAFLRSDEIIKLFPNPPPQPSFSMRESTMDNTNDNSSMTTTRRELEQLTPHPLPKSLQAVIFDIDGTLADSWRLGYDATLVILEKHNIPTITTQEYHACTRYATPHRLALHAGLTEGSEDFYRIGKQLADEFDDLYVGLVSTETAGFFDGLHELLDRIISINNDNNNQDTSSPIALGALTNACVAYAHAVLRANSKPTTTTLQLSQYFDSIHGADTVPSPKPDPDGLLLVCQELGVAPQNAIYVGDSPSDAMAAHHAGMASLGVTWGSHPEESLLKAPFAKLCATVEELGTSLLQR